MSNLELKILDPATDLELFREVYDWRKPKKHVQPDKIPFESFIAEDPLQIVIGVFNGQFIAAFLLNEFEPGRFECHFSSKRGTPRETLVKGGEIIRDAFFQNGAKELCAWVTVRNVALKGYLEALGFTPGEIKAFPKRISENSDSLPEMKEFVKYAITR